MLRLIKSACSYMSPGSLPDLCYSSPSVLSPSSPMLYSESVVDMSPAHTASTYSSPDRSSFASGTSASSHRNLFVIVICPLCNDAIPVTKRLLEKASDVVRWHLYIEHPQATSQEEAYALGTFSPNSPRFTAFMKSVPSHHLGEHTVVEYKSFCPRCWEMFSMAPGEQTQLAKRIQRHLKETAKCLPSIACWVCQVCKRRFRRKDVLKRHQQRFKGDCKHRGRGRGRGRLH
jgi:hypothetical protein